ncbi:AMP-binding protein, partial [Georgenia sp. 10Sc9-8]|nr:AMP-binding protein [Georgenia halotolerans]
AAGVRELTAPALLLWGPRDPVFQERYLRDLIERLPHTDVHRFEGAGHLVVEDADVAGTVVRWLDARQVGEPAATTSAADADRDAPTTAPFTPLWTGLAQRADSTEPAIVALGPDDPTTLTWEELALLVEHLALGLTDHGVRPGDRVVLLVPPGPDLTVAMFACLRLGAVVVLADAGLGTAGLTRAVRGAGADVIIGIERALVGARALRWPGRRVLVERRAGSAGPSGRRDLRQRALGAGTTLRTLLGTGAERAHHGARLPVPPGPEDDAAILFTSGSTGPAKGVAYTHRGIAAMRDAVAATYGLGPDRSLVAGFAPFALLATALGATSSVPDMDVTAPATLTAGALAEAVAAIDADAVFASPSALANAARTAGELTADQRTALARVQLFLSAGAPIAPERLAEAVHLMPGAAAHTPYGMTEVLPVTDVSLEQVRQAEDEARTGEVAGAGGGTCVGRPVPGARVRIVPLDEAGAATGEPTEATGVTGEVLVTAPHLKDRYDRLWATQAHSATWPGWHRTGDVGHLDAAGRLWIEGRLAHVITTSDGVVTPVEVENRAQEVRGVRRAGAVGVGPAGTQQLVVVVETDPTFDPRARAGPSLATPGLARLVRAAVGRPVAAVVRVPELPTDVRHNAKIERAGLAAWAGELLAGRRVGTP